MKLSLTYLKATLAAFLVAMVFAVPALGQSSEAESLMTDLSPAIIANDEGGPTTVTGSIASDNFSFLPELWPDPTVALMDVTNMLRGEPATFIAAEQQILGVLTESLFPGPGQYRVNLPISPAGVPLDVDNDGEEDAGIQIFALRVSPNVINDSYLQQLEQAGGLATYLTDIATGNLTEGTLLLFAPDEEQGFVSGFGEDGLWFTDDDPAVALPAGYTVATLNKDGSVTFDRSAEATMDTMERAEEASADFSDQGLVESYNSLIDLLAERYAYTELRGLDWQQIRQAYLPQVEEADANDDIAAYFVAIDALALSIEDAHVAATAFGNIDAVVAKAEAQAERTAGNVGASVIAVSDEMTPTVGPGDKVVVFTVGDESPAAEAGWVPGTEIVSVNGQSVAARYDEIPLPIGTDVDEVQRVYKTGQFLSFPVSQTVTIGYRLPDVIEVMTATMMTGAYDTGSVEGAAEFMGKTPVSYQQVDSYAVVRWGDFISYVLPKIAVLEEALTWQQGQSSPGVILDLRQNSGGWVELYEMMASYFFTEADPMPTNVFTWSFYDADVGDLVEQYAVDYQLSAPRPELAYTGPLVILIDPLCASACEYFTQHLQTLGRATVVGQYRSTGAGGPIDRVTLPGGISFQYTMGRTTFAGTDEPNLEAKGVDLDVRVPVTMETEIAKRRGEDPVMDAAIALLGTLSDPAAQLTGTTWRWTATLDDAGAEEAIEDDASYTITLDTDGSVAIQADCNQATGVYTLGESEVLTFDVGPTTLAACSEGSRGEELLQLLDSTTGYMFFDGALIIFLESTEAYLGLKFEAVE